MDLQNNDDLDRWLDGALPQYGEAEPRPGLEGRLLVNLKAEAERRRVSSPWLWIVAATSAAVLLTAVWLGIGHRGPRTPEIIANRSVSTNKSVGPAQEMSKFASERPRTTPEPTRTRRSTAGRVHTAVVAASVSEPRLNQFPSSHTLSREELLFVRYAQDFPREAILLAKEQRTFEEEIRLAEEELRNDSTVSDTER
jgi:hypothetical protein